MAQRQVAGSTQECVRSSKATQVFGAGAVISLAAAAIFWMAHFPSLVGVGILGCIISAAALATWGSILSGASFALWMTASVAAPAFYPELFQTWHGFELKRTINPLIMVIMFGMGTSLSFGDFKRVLVMPRAVIIGVTIKYTVMPLVGKLVAMTFARGNADVAAGIILVGNVPAGATSNVINYLAGSNVPLSVTMTAITTIVSPFVTPALTQLLGGVSLEIKFGSMMVSMMTMVVIPVALGVFTNRVLTTGGKMHGNLAAVSSRIFRNLPRFAMFAMCAALTFLTAAARKQLVGMMVATILSSVIVQTIIGLCLGYWVSRVCRLDEKTCRTIAVEAGMQNSGVAASLALNLLNRPLAAVPGVMCSIWQNIAGALLASWWRVRPPQEDVPNRKAAVAVKG
jgi:BASS family bile acid:Na+ symporter